MTSRFSLLMTSLLMVVLPGCVWRYDPATDADPAPGLSLLKAAHNSYDEGPPDTVDRVFAEALALGFHNLEVDVQVDATFSRHGADAEPATLRGKVRLHAQHDCEDMPRARHLSGYLDVLAARAAANGGSVHGDGREVVLTIDVKDCHHPDPHAVALSIDALLTHHAALLGEADVDHDDAVTTRAVTVCLTGDDAVKDAYLALVAASDRTLRACRDRVIGGKADHQARAADYFGPGADAYHRFYSVHWSHVEAGFPGDEGDWTDSDRRRLDDLLAAATARGYRLRFYALDGRGRSYGFTGGRRAAVARWQAFAAAAWDLPGGHFVATDDLADITALDRGPASRR